MFKRKSTGYRRKDKIYLDDTPITGFYALDTETGKQISARDAEHACAIACAQNKRHYGRSRCNWTKWVGVYEGKEGFRFLEFDDSNSRGCGKRNVC